MRIKWDTLVHKMKKRKGGRRKNFKLGKPFIGLFFLII
jgi:hypothetical protein